MDEHQQPQKETQEPASLKENENQVQHFSQDLDVEKLNCHPTDQVQKKCEEPTENRPENDSSTAESPFTSDGHECSQQVPLSDRGKTVQDISSFHEEHRDDTCEQPLVSREQQQIGATNNSFSVSCSSSSVPLQDSTHGNPRISQQFVSVDGLEAGSLDKNNENKDLASFNVQLDRVVEKSQLEDLSSCVGQPNTVVKKSQLEDLSLCNVQPNTIVERCEPEDLSTLNSQPDTLVEKSQLEDHLSPNLQPEKIVEKSKLEIHTQEQKTPDTEMETSKLEIPAQEQKTDEAAQDTNIQTMEFVEVVPVEVNKMDDQNAMHHSTSQLSEKKSREQEVQLGVRKELHGNLLTEEKVDVTKSRQTVECKTELKTDSRSSNHSDDKSVSEKPKNNQVKHSETKRNLCDSNQDKQNQQPQTKKPKSGVVSENFERINYLVQSSSVLVNMGMSNSESPSLDFDQTLASQTGSLAMAVGRRCLIRLTPSLKRMLCKGCGTTLVYGVNARVRHRSNRQKHLVITCLTCNTIKRLINNPKHKLWCEQEEALA